MPAPRPRVPEGVWEIRHGAPRKKPGRTRLGTVQRLDYNNPYRYSIERVWFDGKIVFATEQGGLEVDPRKVKVAQEYQVVYDVRLDARKKLARKPARVPGQLNIDDSVPGMRKHSPTWRFNYVIVPRGYVPNTLRAERDRLASGYEIRRSLVFEN